MGVELTVITPEDVSAFVDGELGREERREVAACAHDDDRVARRIKAWQWQLGLLHSAFGAVVAEPVPDRLACIARRAGRSSLPRRTLWPVCIRRPQGTSTRP